MFVVTIKIIANDATTILRIIRRIRFGRDVRRVYVRERLVIFQHRLERFKFLQLYDVESRFNGTYLPRFILQEYL